MAVGGSEITQWANFLRCGQLEARRLHAQALPGAAIHDPGHCMSALDMAGEGGTIGIQRRPTEPWPGQDVTISDREHCPNCPDSFGEEVWNGLNINCRPFPIDEHGNEILVYGKKPESYFRAIGPVRYWTLVLWNCVNCSKYWYHYLYHSTTCDGRESLQSAAQSSDAPALTAPALVQCHSTPGRVSGNVNGTSWSPAATLVGQLSPDLQLSAQAAAGKQVSFPQRALDASFNTNNAQSEARARLRTRSTPAGRASVPAVPSNPPVTVPTSPMPIPTSHAHRFRPTLEVNTNTNATLPWSTYDSHTIGAPSPAPGLSPLGRSPLAPSPSGLSPLAPNTSAISPIGLTPSPSNISPVVRRPTEPQGPPAKKQQRNADDYLQMRHLLACDDCRTRKKKCNPSHTGPRRPWNKRVRSGKKRGSSATGAVSTNTSPTWSPEMPDGEWPEADSSIQPTFEMDMNGTELNPWSPDFEDVNQVHGPTTTWPPL